MPWRERESARWPALLFGAQGLSLFGAGLAAGVGSWRLLYSAALLDAVVLLVVLSPTWIAVWVVLAKSLADALAAVPSGGERESSESRA
jgi:hypothetical protein